MRLSNHHRQPAPAGLTTESESRPQGSDSLLTPMGYRSFLQIPPPLQVARKFAGSERERLQ